MIERTYYFPGGYELKVTFVEVDIYEKIHYITDILGRKVVVNDRWLYHKDNELHTEGTSASA